MIVEFTEHEGCFAFELTAENMHDAASLVRFGMNATKELRYKGATVNQDGTFGGNVVVAKHKNANNDVPRRK